MTHWPCRRLQCMLGLSKLNLLLGEGDREVEVLAVAVP